LTKRRIAFIIYGSREKGTKMNIRDSRELAKHIARADLSVYIDSLLFDSMILCFKANRVPEAQIRLWQESFDEFLRTYQEVNAEIMGSEEDHFAEVQRRIPNNKWIAKLKVIAIAHLTL
jgi:hypothetical protein